MDTVQAVPPLRVYQVRGFHVGEPGTCQESGVKVTWNRNQFTVGRADPTTVVTWESPELGIKIIEFQSVYAVEVSDVSHTLDEAVAEELHKALEGEYQAELELRESGMHPDES